MENIELWIAIIVAVAAWIPKILELIGRRKTEQSQVSLNIAQSAREIAEGGETAVDAVTKLLTIYETRDTQKTKRIDDQDKEIAILRAQIVSMQIDERNKEARLTEIIEALKDYIEVLVNSLRAHDIEIPPRPDILKESNPKIPRMT